MSAQRPGSGRRPVIAVGLALIAILGVTAALSAWAAPTVVPVALAVFDMDQSAGPDRGVNLTEVAGHPQVMRGRTVTISGRVLEPPEARVFTVGNDAPFVGDRVPVVHPTDLSAVIPTGARIGEGDVVRVTGEVLLRDDAEAELDIALPGGGEGVLVAEAIAVNPEVSTGPGDKELPFWSDGYDLGLTAYDIAVHTDDYLGMTVTVSGEVEQLLGDRVFAFSDFLILAAAREPQPEVFVEATAYVTGEVRRFDRASVEAELGIDLGDALTGREGAPTIVARTVEVVV